MLAEAILLVESNTNIFRTNKPFFDFWFLFHTYLINFFYRHKKCLQYHLRFRKSAFKLYSEFPRNSDYVAGIPTPEVAKPDNRKCLQSDFLSLSMSGSIYFIISKKIHRSHTHYHHRNI